MPHDIHSRLEGEWTTDDGLTRYVFQYGKYKMIESSGVSELTYSVKPANADMIKAGNSDVIHIHVTLLRTGGGHDKYLSFKDADRKIKVISELNGIYIPSIWLRPTEYSKNNPANKEGDRGSP